MCTGSDCHDAIIDSVNGKGKNDAIVCPLWVSNDRRFRSRHYVAWDRACSICGRKVIVTDAVKRDLDANPVRAISCEDCNLMGKEPDPAELLTTSEPDGHQACATCAMLKEREEVAAREAGRLLNIRDSQANAARRRWAHLAKARAQHRLKSHMNEQRGKL